MPTNDVLIDFENVQPKNLSILANHPFKVYVFIGANQTKVPRHVAVAMQGLGDRAQYIEINGKTNIETISREVNERKRKARFASMHNSFVYDSTWRKCMG